MSINNSNKKIFLTANWQYLAMLNYEVDPVVLKKHIPPYTEIDFFEGRALISIVGFLFSNTKVFGIRWPLHANFEEVNLRYYVRHFDGSQWKRGVNFISEIVPRPVISTIANLLYNEHYSAAKMQHHIEEKNETISVTYQWKKRNGIWNSIAAEAVNTLHPIAEGSAEEFIFEHYFGYNQLNDHTTIEYAVEHPRWQIYPVTNFELQCDVAKMYGKDFVPFIENTTPQSVFLAKGSEVIVRKPVYIKK